MDIEVLDHWSACSTLILSNLDNPNEWGEGVSPEILKKVIKKYDDNVREGWGVHYIREYAFVVASTEESQTEAEKTFRKLGFKKTRRVYNEKNGTNVTFWMITVSSLLRKLRKYDI